MAKYTADELRGLGEQGKAFVNADRSYSHPIADAEDFDSVLEEIGRGKISEDLRRFVVGRATELGIEIPEGHAALNGALPSSDELILGPTPCERTYQLEDISIRAGDGGRTVVAYAAVFDKPAEISDQDGHYVETIDAAAFNKTMQDRAGRFGVFYNHGKTIYGTPSERFSMPLGTPEEVRADGRGLLTVTRYNKNPLADEVLESIRNGDITGQSFSGKFLRSQRTRGRGGALDTIHRSEIALREYGPTPMPAYKEAAVLGVRTEELADTLRALTPEQRAEILALIDASRTDVGTATPTEPAAGQATADPIPAPVIHEGPTQSQRQRLAYVLAISPQ